MTGYLQTDDFDAGLEAMPQEPVNARWQADMAPMFEVRAAPDEGLPRLPEIFHLG